MDELIELTYCTKGILSWMHAAHHTTKGTSFSGDHVNLFGEIYEEIIEDFDEMIEKSIAILDDEKVACPIELTVGSIKYLSMFTSPSNLHEDQIAVCALEFVRHHINHLESVYRSLEEKRALSLGMDDFLSSSAGKYEKFEYLLGQRIKKGYSTRR